MRLLKSHRLLFALVIGLLMIVSACSNDASGEVNTNNNTKDQEDQETVTIQVAFPLNEEYFDGRFGEVDKKLDHIDLEYMPYGGTEEDLEEFFSKKQYPDIIVGDYPPIRALDIGYPLDDLIEEHDFDLDRLDPSLLSFMQSLGEDGEVVGFPDGGSFFALYYNKDVFDKFGKDYPDPNVPMTWNELIDLAKDMTGEVDGTQYIGLQGGPAAALDEFAAPLTDADTGEVLVEKNPQFKKYFELLEAFYSIPGMREELPEDADDPFSEEETAAMTIASNNYFAWGFGSPEPDKIEHIDMAPVPVWEDMPETTPANNAWAMVIPEYSEHKDEAFEVLEAYLDPEIQIEMAKTMMLQTPTTDEEVLEHYGSEVSSYEGKNIDAYFIGEAARYEERQSNWDQYVDLGKAEEQLIENKKDVVTILRELAEEAKGEIKSKMESQ